MTQHPTTPQQFFLTPPSPCPYIAGNLERKVFTHLIGEKAREFNDMLMQGGFRRSQNIAYRPACETCRACVSVRILAREFKFTRNMKRVLHANADISGTVCPPDPSSEQYSLFRDYLDIRHRHGGMSDMTVLDYAMMVEDTHVDTIIIEYRRKGRGTSLARKKSGELVAFALTDKMADGLSMVYSCFNPRLEERSLGTFMILDHIARAQEAGLPYVYLGYWVKGSPKMMYKTRFQPQEHLGPKGWERFDASR